MNLSSNSNIGVVTGGRSSKCPEMQPPFQAKEDVFNIESDALALYERLTTINVQVFVVAYATYCKDNPVRVQDVQNIAVCNEYNPNKGYGSMGSGTNIANANFLSFELLPDFFYHHIGIEQSLMQNVVNYVIQNFKN